MFRFKLGNKSSREKDFLNGCCLGKKNEEICVRKYVKYIEQNVKITRFNILSRRGDKFKSSVQE